MRQIHKAGEKLFVDYAGPTVPVINPDTGEIKKAAIFVAVLGASNYSFAEATWSQTMCDWLASHVRAFEFFGGTTTIVVPDNLKSGVTKASRYEPDLNRSYNAMAEHYGTVIIPARPRQPKDNALAESKNGTVVRKNLGFEHIPGQWAPQLNRFHREHFNPYLNFQRPCFFPVCHTDQKGKVIKRYPLSLTLSGPGQIHHQAFGRRARFRPRFPSLP